jgi:hypothetical protein
VSYLLLCFHLAVLTSGPLVRFKCPIVTVDGNTKEGRTNAQKNKTLECDQLTLISVISRGYIAVQPFCLQASFLIID